MSPRQQQKTKLNMFALMGLVTFALDCASTGTSATFPALFSRPRLFQRTQQQVQQQQSQPQQQLQQDHSISEANSLIPAFGAFGLSQNDLMRLGSSQISVQNHHHHQEPRGGFMTPPNHFDSAHYRQGGPQLLEGSALRPQHNQQQFDTAILHQLAATSHHEPQSLRMEQSQSEVVDKIERHIGQQIEQSLKAGNNHQALAEHHLGHKIAQASVYQEPSAPTSGEQRGGSQSGSSEKEASASGEEAEGEQASAEEPSGGAAEKRSHHEHDHHHKETHEEHPPEAFEVHHKKGGKSFQYFHQGHHSHYP